jgi:hypothetical protein
VPLVHRANPIVQVAVEQTDYFLINVYVLKLNLKMNQVIASNVIGSALHAPRLPVIV